MTFQTSKKDDNNRYKKLTNQLKNELCSIWLGMGDSNYLKISL
jgi:hypothetical protein